MTESYRSPYSWDSKRPHVLVVACSDGRLQEALDEFLDSQLGIVQYDRLYLPGGPGALASSGSDFSRSDRHRREFEFLLDAHAIEEVLFVFHGPSADGPPEAACADYRRLFGNVEIERIRHEQERDVHEIMHRGMGFHDRVRVRVFWCEVRSDGRVQFVEGQAV